MKDCIGLDISKSSISVHIPRNKLDIEIDNNLTGMKKLYSKLKKLYKKEYKELVFIYEPTGNYSIPLTRFCKQMHEIIPFGQLDHFTRTLRRK